MPLTTNQFALTLLQEEDSLTLHVSRYTPQNGAQPALLAAWPTPLPFTPASFAAILCQHAGSAMPDIGQFLRQVARLLRPGGQLTLIESVVPGSRLRGKKGDVPRRVAHYLNSMARLHDAKHLCWLSLEQWQDALHAAGFTLIQHEQRDQLIYLANYATHLPAPQRLRLQAMIVQAPQPVTAVLTPQIVGDRITFRLGEAIIVAQWRGVSREP